jgi:hypothetical protein
MSQGAFAKLIAGLLGLLAALVSFAVLGFVEVYTVPTLIEQVLFHGDPSAGFGLGFLVVGAAYILLPLNILVAAAIGLVMYKKLKKPAP